MRDILYYPLPLSEISKPSLSLRFGSPERETSRVGLVGCIPWNFFEHLNGYRRTSCTQVDEINPPSEKNFPEPDTIKTPFRKENYKITITVTIINQRN